MVATADFLSQRFRLDVRTRHEALGIDRARKIVVVRDSTKGTTYEQPYGKLILAPGASPIVPPLEGIDTANVFTLRNVEDTDEIHVAMRTVAQKRAVVVGAGFIGLEMVEQLSRKGFAVALVELQPQILPLLDREMAQPLEQELRDHNVDLYLGQAVQRILPSDDGTVTAVELQDGTQLDASIVMMGVGVRPNHQLAQKVGLGIGADGGIETNEFMQTTDPDIYAVGDAAEYRFGPTGQPMRSSVSRSCQSCGPAGGRACGHGLRLPDGGRLGHIDCAGVRPNGGHDRSVCLASQKIGTGCAERDRRRQQPCGLLSRRRADYVKGPLRTAGRTRPGSAGDRVRGRR